MSIFTSLFGTHSEREIKRLLKAKKYPEYEDIAYGLFSRFDSDKKA